MGIPKHHLRGARATLNKQNERKRQMQNYFKLIDEKTDEVIAIVENLQMNKSDIIVTFGIPDSFAAMCCGSFKQKKNLETRSFKTRDELEEAFPGTYLENIWDEMFAEIPTELDAEDLHLFDRCGKTWAESYFELGFGYELVVRCWTGDDSCPRVSIRKVKPLELTRTADMLEIEVRSLLSNPDDKRLGKLMLEFKSIILEKEEPECTETKRNQTSLSSYRMT